MSTEKQIAANRLNAQKSTGPRTDAGKTESALNATRHITLSRSVLLRCESPERFSAFVENFHRDFHPRTATEISLVNSIASARWRLMRMSHVEAVNVDSEYVKQIHPPVVPLDFDTPDRAGLAYRDLVRNSRVLDLVGRAEGRLLRQFHAALTQLTKMRVARGAIQDEAPQDSAEIDMRCESKQKMHHRTHFERYVNQSKISALQRISPKPILASFLAFVRLCLRQAYFDGPSTGTFGRVTEFACSLELAKAGDSASFGFPAG